MSSFLAPFRGSLHTLNVLIMLLMTSNTHRYWQPRSTKCSAALLHSTCFLEPTTYLATDLFPVHPTTPGTTCSIETGRDQKSNQPYLLGLPNVYLPGLPIRKRN